MLILRLRNKYFSEEELREGNNPPPEEPSDDSPNNSEENDDISAQILKSSFDLKKSLIEEQNKSQRTAAINIRTNERLRQQRNMARDRKVVQANRREIIRNQEVDKGIGRVKRAETSLRKTEIERNNSISRRKPSLPKPVSINKTYKEEVI